MVQYNHIFNDYLVVKAIIVDGFKCKQKQVFISFNKVY